MLSKYKKEFRLPKKMSLVWKNWYLVKQSLSKNLNDVFYFHLFEIYDTMLITIAVVHLNIFVPPANIINPFSQILHFKISLKANYKYKSQFLILKNNQTTIWNQIFNFFKARLFLQSSQDTMRHGCRQQAFLIHNKNFHMKSVQWCWKHKLRRSERLEVGRH